MAIIILDFKFVCNKLYYLAGKLGYISNDWTWAYHSHINAFDMKVAFHNNYVTN
jgi:hypothetical protein